MGKVLLIRPSGGPAGTENMTYEHLGLGYLSAYLQKHGIAVDLFDTVLRPQVSTEIARRAVDENCRLVGITVPSQEAVPAILELAQEIKQAQPDIHLCLGGHFPTAAHDLLLRDFSYLDSVVRGEGEKPLLELASRVLSGDGLSGVRGLSYRYKRQIVSEPAAQPPDDLDDLPFPRRDFLPADFGSIRYATIVSSRGCQYKCIYCSIHTFYGGAGWRGRSVTNIVEEMAELHEREGITGFYFADDNFVPPGAAGVSRVNEFCNELRARKLHRLTLVAMFGPRSVSETTIRPLVEVGLRSVLVGLESASSLVLNRFKKATTPAVNSQALRLLGVFGLNISAGFIMFDPDTSLADIKDNIRFLRRHLNRLSDCRLLNRLQVYTGTSAYHDLLARGRLTGTYLNPQYEFSDERIAWLYQVSTELMGGWIDLIEDWARGRQPASPQIPLAYRRKLWRQTFAYMLNVFSQLTHFVETTSHLPSVEEAASRLARPVDSGLEHLTETLQIETPRRKGSNEFHS